MADYKQQEVSQVTQVKRGCDPEAVAVMETHLSSQGLQQRAPESFCPAHLLSCPHLPSLQLFAQLLPRSLCSWYCESQQGWVGAVDKHGLREHKLCHSCLCSRTSHFPTHDISGLVGTRL